MLGFANPFDDPWIVRVIRNPEHLPLSELLAVPQDEDAKYANDRWTNRDLIPIPRERQTWTALSYFGYWTVTGMGVATWSLGSSAIAYGLNCKQALGAIAAGAVIVGFLAVIIGVIGQRWRIGYTVSSRAAFGFYGCYLPIAIKSFIACIWQGMHFYYMGQALVGTLGSLSPVFIEGYMGTPFSDWSPLKRNELVGVFLALILFCFVMTIPPEKMQPMVHISFILQTGSFFGLMAWSVHANGGKLGPLWEQPSSTKGSPVWAAFYMISSICGSNSGVLGQSDWTRYTKTKFAPNFSQIITAPVTLFLTAAMGIIASAAHEQVLGTIYWNPVTLLPQILLHYNFSSSSRAGVFFASFGVVSGQLWQAVLLTACSTGMDISGYCPKYINIRRGSYLMSIIGICCQPWKLLATSNTFLTVLNGFSVFVGPLVGCAVADFFFVRRMKYRLPDLYRTNPSIYWSRFGLNWRGIASTTIGTVPTFPGLVYSASGTTMNGGYQKFYNLTYLVGAAITILAHTVIGWFFPPPGVEGAGEGEVDVDEGSEKGREEGREKGDYGVDVVEISSEK